ncbi:MAG: CPBP family intramembrane metalloprotease [Chitinophagaceae bacterium]|nr:CPBP family intramembrane metalloprotease [Chitinophagaceae bacterium]
MFNRYLTYYSPAMQFVVFCALVSMCWLLGGTIYDLLNVNMTGLNSSQIAELTTYDYPLAQKLKWINGIIQIVMLLLPAAIFTYLAYPSPATYAGLKKPQPIKYLAFGILMLLVALPFSSWLEQLNSLIHFGGEIKKMDAKYTALAGAMLAGTSIQDLIVNTLLICILPAFVEEIFFRGCLQQIMVNWMQKTPLLAVFLVALLFSLFHGQLSGLIPRTFLGLLLGLAYYYTGSLWVSMAMHVVNNFFAVLFFFLYQSHRISFNILETPDTPIWLGLLSGGITAAFIYMLYQMRRPYEIFALIPDEPKPTNETP